MISIIKRQNFKKKKNYLSLLELNKMSLQFIPKKGISGIILLYLKYSSETLEVKIILDYKVSVPL